MAKPATIRRLATIGAALAILAPWTITAHGSGIDTGVLWETQAVRYPAAVADLEPRAPYVPERAKRVRGAVEVGPDRVAVLWIGSAELIRVRGLWSPDLSKPPGAPIEGDAARRSPPSAAPVLRFGRITGRADGGRMVTAEPGVVVGDREWYLVQPPGGGNLWYIGANQPLQVIVERPRAVRAKLYWEKLRRELLTWIREDGPMPSIPMTPGSDRVELLLRTDRAVAMTIARSYPATTEAVEVLREWRKASALAALETLRPASAPYQARRRVDGGFGREVALYRGKGGEEAQGQSYRAVPGKDTSWTLELEGPGVLRIHARAMNAGDTSDHRSRQMAIELSSQGALLARDSGSAAAALSRVSPKWSAALPLLDEDGKTARLVAGDRPVGLRREIAWPLFAGRHTYRIRVIGGPAAIRATATERRARLSEALVRRAHPDAFLRRAQRALDGARNIAPTPRALLQLLLDELGSPLPSIPAQLRELPPLLQLVALRTQYRRQQPALAEINDLAARVIQLFAAASPGPKALASDQVLENPILLWGLRIGFAKAFARWRASEHVAALIPVKGEPPPVDLLGEFGDLLAEVPSLPAFPSLALRAAALSWLERPGHPDRRRLYLSVWRHKTEWSILPPARSGSGDAVSWRWVANTARGVDCREADVRGSVRLFHVPLRAQCGIQVPALQTAPNRPAIMRVHLFTPDDTPGPVTVRVGDRSWSLLAFERFQAIEIATPPGRYPVQVDGPPRTLAYVALPSTLQGLNLRGTPIRRRWPLSAGGKPVVYHLPAPAGAAPIHLELREVVAEGNKPDPSPIDLTLHTDAGMTVAIQMSPGPVESEFVNLRAPGMLTAPVSTIVRLPPETREVWLTSSTRRQIVAAMAIRRASGHGIRTADALDNPSPGSKPGEQSAPSAPGNPEASSPSAAQAETPSSTGADNPTNSPNGEQPQRPAAAGCGPMPPATDNPLIAELYHLSRCLLRTPDNVPARLARSQLYWELGRSGYARRDIQELVASVDEDEIPSAVVQRLDDWRRRSHLRPQPEPDPIAGPTAIAPAWLALDVAKSDLLEWLPTVRWARVAGAKGALERLDKTLAGKASKAATAYLRARLSEMAGDHRAAAAALVDAYTQSKKWQIGLAALDQLVKALEAEPDTAEPEDDLDPSDLAPRPAADISGPKPVAANALMNQALASLTYGLALELRQTVEHVAIRRALAVAGPRSRWQPIRGIDAHAGFERLYVDARQLDLEPQDQVAWARLAPPWADRDSQHVTAGRGARIRFQLTRSARVSPQVFCRDPNESAPPLASSVEGAVPTCVFDLRVDQRPPVKIPVARGRRTTLPTIELGDGTHEIVASLAGNDRALAASVRFFADRPIARGPAKATPGVAKPQGYIIPVRRPSRSYWARSDKPIVLNIAGPTVLRIELRGAANQPTGRARIRARLVPVATGSNGSTPGPAREGPRKSASIERIVALDDRVDQAVSSDAARGLAVRRPVTAMLLLEQPGIHRLEITPQSGGAVLARFSIRVDNPAVLDDDSNPGPERATSDPAAATTWAWMPYSPELSKVHTMARPPEPYRSFAMAAEMGAGRDDVGTRDITDADNSRVDVTLSWRRRNSTDPGRLWLGLDGWARWRFDTSVALGADAGARLRHLPLGLRLSLSGRAARQKIEECCTTWSVSGRAALSRSLRLGPSLWVIPGLRFDAEHYRINPGSETRDEALDVRVFSRYGKNHPFALIPRATLYWRPFQDQVALATAYAVSNADLRTLDNVGIRGTWRGMIETSHLFGPFFELTYRFSRRFEDEHRTSSYFRHDIGAGLEWTVWRGHAGRLALSLRDVLILSKGVSNENIFRIGLRFDWTGGRGLIDSYPTEVEFDDFQEPRIWSQLR